MKGFIKNIISKYLREDYNSEEVITVYHGTKSKHVDEIVENGLVSKSGYHQGWYMVSTDFESALFHSHPESDGEDTYVIEFQIPIKKNDFWVGYPYLWEGQDMGNGHKWFALMKRIPKEYIVKVHVIDYKIWKKQKNIGF